MFVPGISSLLNNKSCTPYSCYIHARPKAEIIWDGCQHSRVSRSSVFRRPIRYTNENTTLSKLHGQSRTGWTQNVTLKTTRRFRWESDYFSWSEFCEPENERKSIYLAWSFSSPLSGISRTDSIFLKSLQLCAEYVKKWELVTQMILREHSFFEKINIKSILILIPNIKMWNTSYTECSC